LAVKVIGINALKTPMDERRMIGRNTRLKLNANLMLSLVEKPKRMTERDARLNLVERPKKMKGRDTRLKQNAEMILMLVGKPKRRRGDSLKKKPSVERRTKKRVVTMNEGQTRQGRKHSALVFQEILSYLCM
jgi:hypothetical protein